MKYILHVFGYKLADNSIIECADEEDLGNYAKSAIMDEWVEQIVAERDIERFIIDVGISD